MSNLTLTRFCKVMLRFRNESDILDSSISKNIKQDNRFVSMHTSGAIVKTKKPKGPGSIWNVKDMELFNKHSEYYCPQDVIDPSFGERHNNIRTSRDSKSHQRKKSFGPIFIRSNDWVQINTSFLLNKKLLFLGTGFIEKDIRSIAAVKICFVENFENFHNEKASASLMKEGWTLIYPNGRIGNNLLKKIEALDIKHWGDPDFVGLNEFAKIKSHFPEAELVIPNNYIEDVSKFGSYIKEYQGASEASLLLAKKDPAFRELLDKAQKSRMVFEQEGHNV